MLISDTHCRYMMQLGLLPQDYETLQAAQADITKAFKIQALLYHPDRNRGREAEATEKFRAADQAREELAAALGGLNIESEDEGDDDGNEEGEAFTRSKSASDGEFCAAPARASHLRDELIRAEACRAALAAEAVRRQRWAAARAERAAYVQVEWIARREAVAAWTAEAVEHRRAAADASRREAACREQQRRLAQQQLLLRRARGEQLRRAASLQRDAAWRAHQRVVAAREQAQLQRLVREQMRSGAPSQARQGIARRRDTGEGSASGSDSCSSEHSGLFLDGVDAKEEYFFVGAASHPCAALNEMQQQPATPTFLELSARIGGRTAVI
jgi:hypothetical protein